MRFLFIRAERANYPVTVLCSVLEVARSGYYAFESRKPSKRARVNEQLREKIVDVYDDCKGRYGAPRVHRELLAMGECASLNLVSRIMSENDLAARPKRAFGVTTDSNHGLPVA